MDEGAITVLRDGAVLVYQRIYSKFYEHFMLIKDGLALRVARVDKLSTDDKFELVKKMIMDHQHETKANARTTK
jgi:hypothetical protein